MAIEDRRLLTRLDSTQTSQIIGCLGAIAIGGAWLTYRVSRSALPAR